MSDHVGRLAAVASLLLAGLPLTGTARAQTVSEYLIPSSSPNPGAITAGPDGALWFTEFAIDQIGRIDPATKAITEFPLPPRTDCQPAFPNSITTGPDGALWFTEGNDNRIARMTTAGVVTEFPIPGFDPCADQTSLPDGITAGSDGALWFTEAHGNKIGRITTSGVMTEFAISTANADPEGITAGPDGALWFTENRGTKIGRITTAGVIKEFPLPSTSHNPQRITVGADGALWFTEVGSDAIGRITTAGAVTEFPLPSGTSRPAALSGITAGADGALWFTEYDDNQIGRISTGGAVTEFALPNPFRGIEGIAAGSDGALWFTELFGEGMSSTTGGIGRITTPTVVLNVNPTTIYIFGGLFGAPDRATLTWLPTGGDSCTASGAWSGPRNPQGGSESEILVAGSPIIPADRTFWLTCKYPNGTTASGSATLKEKLFPDPAPVQPSGPAVLGSALMRDGSILLLGITPALPPIVPAPPMLGQAILIPGNPIAPVNPVIPITISCTEGTVPDASGVSTVYASGMGADSNAYFILVVSGQTPNPPPVGPSADLGLVPAASAGITKTPSGYASHCQAGSVDTGSFTGAFLLVPSPPPI